MFYYCPAGTKGSRPTRQRGVPLGRLLALFAVSLSCAGVLVATTPDHAVAETLSLPSNAPGLAGQETGVALSVAGAAGFISIDVDITFNNSVIVANRIERESLAAANGCTVTSNFPEPPDLPDPTLTKAIISLFCTTPVSTNGPLLRLFFNVVGAQGNVSPLTFTFCEVDGSASRCTTTNGQLTVVASANVSGKIVYYNGLATTPPVAQQRPVGGAVINLLGALASSATTTANGTYTIGAFKNAQATVRPEKLGDLNNAVNSFDAALIARHLVGLGTPLNARQLIAAETSGNGSLNILDAQRIAQLRVGLRDQLAMGDDCDTDFVFLPEAASVPTQTIQQPNTDVRPIPTGPGCVYGQISYSSLGADAANQSFVAILMGDVNGSWVPPTVTALSTTGAPKGAGAGPADARLSVGRKVAKSGATVTVPVRITRARGAIGVDLQLQYAADVLMPLSVDTTALSQGMTLVKNLGEPGLIQVALFGPEELRREGELLTITFAVIGESGDQSQVELIEALVNGSQAVTHNGSVRVR